MPIYEFKCMLCGVIKEVKTTKYEVPTEICCGVKMVQVFSPATVVYKGAGFATTEARGITGRKRKPNIKVGMLRDLPPEEREKHLG